MELFLKSYVSEVDKVKVSSRFKVRRGVSDLVVVLTLIAISIPVAMALQNWLGAQASRMNSYVTSPKLQGVVVGKSSGEGYSVIIVKVKNSGDVTYNLSKANISVILKDGTVVSGRNGSVKVSIAGPLELQPGRSTILSIKIKGYSEDQVKAVVIDTGGGSSIPINTD